MGGVTIYIYIYRYIYIYIETIIRNPKKVGLFGYRKSYTMNPKP